MDQSLAYAVLYNLPVFIVGFFFIFPPSNVWVRVLILIGASVLLVATETMINQQQSVSSSPVDQYNRTFPKAPY